MYHFAARYYDPNIGRLTTPDPSGQEKNPYLYAAGDPVNNIDPSGLGWLQKAEDFLSGHESKVGAVTGCIAGVGAAAETGIIQAASVLGGPAGTVGAAVASCAVGGAMGYAGMDHQVRMNIRRYQQSVSLICRNGRSSVVATEGAILIVEFTEDDPHSICARSLQCLTK
ncbi:MULTISPECIES: RHS repeat-associated core domain-containing protein [unclassified Streptomyces]|uniref:RHS repeat-associated core domain-containing protein n=1 Tax=unclassified Streptomyces TaxID=2593676 RepID=UPI003B639D42